MAQNAEEQIIQMLSDNLALSFAQLKNITDPEEIEDIKLVFFGFSLLTVGKPQDLAYYGYKAAFDVYCSHK
jgi:hypothetical protein